MLPGGGTTFYDVLTAAVAEMTELGYSSPERVAYWVNALRLAALRSMTSDTEMDAAIRAALAAVYRDKITKGGILRQHPGLPRFTIERLGPQLRVELDRAIIASANLIKLNRAEAVSNTIRRFSGWSTSIPPGGSGVIDRREVKQDIAKPMKTLQFQERRVNIDQGHKLIANMSEILARDGGALAGIWRSNWRQKNYDYREPHKERDGHIYMVRGNWAQESGLIKPGPAGYVDDVTRPGQEVFCRCTYQWIHSVAALPESMITKKGREKLDKVRGIAA